MDNSGSPNRVVGLPVTKAIVDRFENLATIIVGMWRSVNEPHHLPSNLARQRETLIEMFRERNYVPGVTSYEDFIPPQPQQYEQSVEERIQNMQLFENANNAAEIHRANEGNNTICHILRPLGDSNTPSAHLYLDAFIGIYQMHLVVTNHGMQQWFAQENAFIDQI